MKLTTPKCDSSLQCATCAQRDIPCIRGNGRKHPLKPRYDQIILHSSPESFLLTFSRELHDTLIKAVHALYQACKGNSDMTEVGDITTHAILESLDLIDQTDPDSEAGPKNPSPEGTRSPSTSTISSPSPVFTSSESPSRSDSMSSISHQSTGSGGSFPSPESVDCMVGLRTASIEASSITPPSWQSLPTLISANDFDYFEPHHVMPPLFGTDFPETGLLSGTGMTNTAPTVPPYDDTTSVMFNDFPLYHESVGEIRPPEQDRPAQEDFGFDPVSPLSKHSLVKIGDVEMMSSWYGFERHTEHGNLESPPAGFQSSICTSTLPEAHSWEGGDLSTVLTNLPFHSGAVSPKELAPTTTSEHSSTTLPSERWNGRASTRSAYKRRRKWSGDSTSAGPQLPESQKRRISLEKNRRAAAKCREKKRSEIHQLKETSRASAAENSVLKRQTKQMREEILNLGSKLLTHMSRGGCRRPEEVRMVLDDRLDRFYCETTQGSRCKETE
jgi:hypothetical protein